MINIEIDGKKIEVEEGSMIIEAADDAGIHIPRFCYHKKLSIAANCRMCLVEVEKAPKALPACATPVTPDMKVYTHSDRALEAQKAVMEFLLINHPLDCPICDQGGQCELQDVALGYGKSVSRYNEGKRSFDDEDLGSLIATEMTRCIHCTRCVRFGEEVAGIRELGATGRGEYTQIGTYIKHSLTSEISGNIIDVCPVGALTSKPFRFRARAWELQQFDGIAPHDCLGSHLHIHARRGEVMRVVPKEHEAINEVWLSDRDRFSYEGLNSDERLLKPMIKRDGQWQEVEWVEALKFTAERLGKISAHHSASQIGGIISPSATTEELFLFQKLLRGLGSYHIDHRLRQSDFRDQDRTPLFPGLTFAIADLENIESALLIGSDIQREQPVANIKLRKAALNDAKIASINPLDFSFNFPQTQRLIVHPDLMVANLAAILRVLLEKAGVNSDSHFSDQLRGIDITDAHREIAEALRDHSQSVIVLGALAYMHPQMADIYALAQHIAALTDSKIGWLTQGANTAGAWIAGCVPHRGAVATPLAKQGLTLRDMFLQQLKAYILFNVEPELDCVNPQAATSALKAADLVIALTPFKGGVVNAHADVLLPIASFTETSGTFINAEGIWQSFNGAVSPKGDARPGWKVLRVLGNLCEIAGFDYNDSTEIRDELQKLYQHYQPQHHDIFPVEKITHTVKNNELTRITQWPMYRVDSLVRRASALQDCAANEMVGVYMNQASINQYHLTPGQKVQVKQQQHSVELLLYLDERVPNHCAYIAGGFNQTAKLGDAFATVEIKTVGE
ncbi:MAG: NADH-quinone oxidoreductase subunit NuoG [Legionellales bacterium]|nr:NADH-quinone oxidoreductase subunit NuoG [Legionellales bacterium]